MAARGRVLVSGASIAGPAVAHWLHRYGFEVTLLERADGVRPEGQNIDVRGAGREVLRRMGLEGRVREATTGEVGTRFVDADGGAIAEFPAGTGDSDGATAELEVLRGLLAGLLVDATGDGVEKVYADQVEQVRQYADHVTVALAHGGERDFDLVVVAEGIGSRTRGLVFDDEVRIRDLGLCSTYVTIPRTDDDDAWWRWHNAPGGRSVTLRPDNVGTTRATLSFLSPDRGYDDLDVAGQCAVLRERFGDVGWAAGRILDALDDLDRAGGASGLYLEHVGQVHAPAWSSSRVVLLGDAAYCASPISGMGTSLALAGAYVLAGELAAHTHHRDAFARYEALMRPYVRQAQKLPPGAPRSANPRSKAGIRAFNTVLRVAASRPVRSIGGRLFTPPADALDLPDYRHLEVARST